MYKIIRKEEFNQMQSRIEKLEEIVKRQQFTIKVNADTIRNMAKKLSSAMFRNPKTGRFMKVQEEKL